MAQPTTSTPVHQAPAEPSSNYANSQSAYDQQPEAQYSKHVTGNSPAKQANMVSKYGDGFVSSASDPKLGEQYGNITSRLVCAEHIFCIFVYLEICTDDCVFATATFDQ